MSQLRYAMHTIYARGRLRSHWHRTTMPLNAEPSDTCSDDDIAAALWAEQPELQHSDNDIEPVSQSKLSSKLRKVPANVTQNDIPDHEVE